jgi:hypothetical protein
MSLITDSRQVNLNSQSATQYKNGSFLSYVNYSFDSFIKPEKDIVSISCGVQNASIPLSFYIINEYNNKFEFSFDNINKTIVYFTYGNYNANTFIQEFQSKTPFLASFDRATGKYTFSYSSTFYFHYENSTAFKVLGFHNQTTYNSIGNIIIAPFLADFSGIRVIKIRSVALVNNNLDSNTMTHSGDLCSIPVTTGYYGIINYTNTNNFTAILSNKYINAFDIQLVDEYDELIDFNNVSWSITLQFDILRKVNILEENQNNFSLNKLVNLLTNILINQQVQETTQQDEDVQQEDIQQTGGEDIDITNDEIISFLDDKFYYN